MAGLAAGMLLAACGGSDAAGGGDAAPSTADAAPSATVTAGVEISEPTAAQRRKYIAAVRKIEPGLVDDEDGALSSGKDVCLDLAQGKTASQVQRNTALRFDVEPGDARKVIAAAKRYLC